MVVNRSHEGHHQVAHAFQFREWATLLLSFCVIGIIGALAYTHLSPAFLSHVLSENRRGEARPRTAAILVEIDPARCRQFVFDNDSGRILPSSAPCEQNATDAHGNPVPTGTVRRLDAISRSFSGR